MSEQSEARLSFLRRLRAVREFTGEPVAREQIEQILEVGRWSGSGGNRQPWNVVVVRDAGLRGQMGEWGARPAANADVVLLIVMTSEGSSLDEGRLAERLCLGAAAVGLGSTVATLKNEGPERVKQILGIPAERRAVAVVAIGHVDRAARKAKPPLAEPRKPMGDFARWDRF